MLAGALAILKTGAAYVPLDPAFPADRLAYMLEDSGAKLLLSDSQLAPQLQSDDVEAVLCDKVRTGLFSARPSDPDIDVSSSDLAYVIYTSGSTGKPKGVQLEHRGVVNFLNSMCREPGIGQDDTLLAVTTLSFDIAVLELFGPLSVGATTVIASRDEGADPEKLKALLDTHDVSIMQATPATWRMLLQSGWDGNDDLTILCGGEALARELAERLCHAGRSLWNMYGPTETTIWSSVKQINAGDPIITVGKPIDNTQFYVLDEQMNPAPIGVAGELFIGGDGVARGYWQRDELNAEKFLDNPFIDGGRIYRTGDLARFLRDGELEVLGRTDFQVKLRGFRIELGEIEAALVQHETINESVVVLREDIPGDQRLVGYVTGKGIPDNDTLRRFLKAALPDYMVPTQLVILDELPLTPNGKVDRKALPAPDWTPVQEYVAPRTPVEEALAGIFADVLGVEQAGIHDDFFALGGHSLLATQLVSRVRDALDAEIPLQALFESPTVAELAAGIDGAAAADTAIPVSKRPDNLPLSFGQHRLWFLDQLEPVSAAYNLPFATRLSGPLDTERLRTAIATLTARHESLRTRFPSVNGEPVQVIDADVQHIPLRVIDISGATDSELNGQLTALTNEPFDLSVAPLFRVDVLSIGPEDHALLLTIHHIISDAWSVGVWFRELTTLYDQGAETSLAPLVLQYADFTLWQREQLSGEKLQNQVEYWTDALAGAPPLLELPTDRPRPPVQSYNGAWHSHPMSADLLGGLKRIAREHRSTLYMVLLAAYDVLLARHSKQTDIVVGSPIAGRRQSELEGQIGLFINTLVMRADLDDNPRFAELLARVRANTLSAYEHQDLPFEKLVEELHPVRDMSYSPVFQVAFFLQNTPVREEPFGDLKASVIDFEPGTTKFDLTLAVQESDERLISGFEYNTDLFDAATIEALAEHFDTLLHAIVADPTQTIFDLPLLGPAEQHLLLTEFNDSAGTYDHAQTLHGLFEAQARRTPDAPAAAFGNHTLIYRELNDRANSIANTLMHANAGPGDRIGIYLERSTDMLAGALAILKTGAAYVPLDPAFPADRLAYMLEDSGAKLLLTESSLKGQLDGADTESIASIDLDEIETRKDLENPVTDVSSSDLAYVIYTSGSTGKPKGVQLEHRGVVNFLNSMCREPGIGQDDTLLAVTTLSFDIAVLELFGPLSVGATTVIASRDEGADPEKLKALLDTHDVSIMQATPATWRMLLQSGWDGNDDLTILCGGEALARELTERLCHAGRSLWNMYGPTETTIWSSVKQINAGDPIITVGKPIDNTQFYVLDEQMNPAPIGLPENCSSVATVSPAVTGSVMN